jgi:hypothetical protein
MHLRLHSILVAEAHGRRLLRARALEDVVAGLLLRRGAVPLPLKRRVHERLPLLLLLRGARLHGDCPGRKSPVLAVKRPARPYKSATQNRFTMENAKGG